MLSLPVGHPPGFLLLFLPPAFISRFSRQIVLIFSLLSRSDPVSDCPCSAAQSPEASLPLLTPVTQESSHRTSAIYDPPIFDPEICIFLSKVRIFPRFSRATGLSSVKRVLNFEVCVRFRKSLDWVQLKVSVLSGRDSSEEGEAGFGGSVS